MVESGHFYFAYGSNMNPARVDKRKMGYTRYEGGVLKDHRLAFNKASADIPGHASANVMFAAGQFVEGVIYHLTDAAQIEIMDPFEGHPVRYYRDRYPIVCESGTYEAWVYIANQEFIREGLRPARWYLEHLLAGRPHLSPTYFESLANVSCLPDSEVEPR